MVRSIEKDCLHSYDRLEVKVTNEGNKAAHDVDVRAYSTNDCEFSMRVGDTNYLGRDFFNITTSAYPLKDPYNIEMLMGGEKLITGAWFSFTCPQWAQFEISVGGENFAARTKVCK